MSKRKSVTGGITQPFQSRTPDGFSRTKIELPRAKIHALMGCHPGQHRFWPCRGVALPGGMVGCSRLGEPLTLRLVSLAPAHHPSFPAGAFSFPRRRDV